MSHVPQRHDGSLSAMDDSGSPVDWWFIYKVSGKSESSKGVKPSGREYAYFDSNMAAKNGKLMLSANTVESGALASTLHQVYEDAATPSQQLGWFFYNDEDPRKPQGFANSSRGHCKGVLAFDLRTDSAFWLIQSTPRFPTPEKYSFPASGTEMAQTFLCVTLPNADTARIIADLMYHAHQPNVYLASGVPAGLAKDDPRALLIQNHVATDTKPVAERVPFNSKGGQKFLAIAKNKYYGKDFYNDLVGPTLAENMEVETWGHGKTPGELDSDKKHKIEIMKSVNLGPLDIPFCWSEEFDHAKLAVSAQSEKGHWVCVGDINDTIAQEKRGGGTVCFQCAPLWDGLVKVLSTSSLPKLAHASAPSRAAQ